MIGAGSIKPACRMVGGSKREETEKRGVIVLRGSF